MKVFILFIFTLVTLPVFAQPVLSLQECYALAEKSYPIAKQSNLFQQKSEYEIEALNKAKLPTIGLNAQATYQSEVTAIPIKLPNTTITPLRKDQYRATLDINQLIYNGGMIDANSKLKLAQTQTQQQQVAVNLYQLKSRINFSYMMILLWQEQRALLTAKQNTINTRIKEVQSGVKNGAILPSSEQILEAEVLKLDQALTENLFQQKAALQNLSSLTASSIEENTVLEKPIVNLGENSIRPETKYFELQEAQIEAFKNILSKVNLPMLNAFGQVGYGNPGLNMLNNSFQDFYMMGLKLHWNLLDWNKSKTDKQALDIAKEIMITEKETFETNNQIQLNDLQFEISKIEALIKTDAQIIQLREKIVQSSDSQLRNGVITSSDYITELNHLFDAKTNQKVHETQLELAKINYQTTKGIK